jgi:2,4'-dihydroxyacetophenone dioxygenase
MKDNVTHKVETAAPGETKRFSDGSLLVRLESLPWTPLGHGMNGIDFKLLSIDWERHIYVVYQRLLPGSATVEHYHYGAAYAWVVEGDFSYEYGHVKAGSYLCEGSDILHVATAGDKGVTVLAVLFDGIGPLGADGNPDTSKVLDCLYMYNAAKANGAADHILPPPADYRKLALWPHAHQYKPAA